MTVEESVARHYAHGSLERKILEALAASGKDPDRLSAGDLSPVDEFHIGGRQATIAFAEQFGVREGMRLLDVGCGLGGASRYFALEHRCRVTGVDLSEEYVAVAGTLAERVGLADRVSYRQGSALALPFPPASFDAAYLFHVGMNIEDKAALFAQVRRVLAPSGAFGIYDVMRTGDGELRYPVPWASGAETSFVADPGAYRRLLEAAGFQVLKERSRREFVLELFRQMRGRAAEVQPAGKAAGKPPPLGLHIVMGATAGQKVANMMQDIEAGLIAPFEMICRSA